MPTDSEKLDAVVATFGAMGELEPEAIEFFFSRRHLAKSGDGSELAYVVDFDEMEAMIGKRLRAICARDGATIMREVAGRLVESIEMQAEIAR